MYIVNSYIRKTRNSTKETITMRTFLSSTDPPPLLAHEFYKEHEGFYKWLIEHPDILNGTREEIDVAKVKYDAMRAKKKKRNKKRKEGRETRRRKKRRWKLRRDQPLQLKCSVLVVGGNSRRPSLQLIANEFAKEHGTPQFPVHVTYSYGNDEFNHEFNAQYADPPWFDPMDMKHIVWQPPDDMGMVYCRERRIYRRFRFHRHEKENCLFHNIQIPVFITNAKWAPNHA